MISTSSSSSTAVLDFTAYEMDRDCLRSVFGDANQVVIYGYKHCRYELVAGLLKKLFETTPLKKVFLSGLCNMPLSTVEGRLFSKYEELECRKSKSIGIQNRMWTKASLVSVVIENMQRSREDIPLIPVIFCVDITDNPYPLVIANMVKRVVPGGAMTGSEIRRAYKLCYERSLHRFIKIVARETFHFVKVEMGVSTCSLKPIEPPWGGRNKAHWNVCWVERMRTSSSHKKDKHWRVKITEKMESLASPQREKRPHSLDACEPLPKITKK